MPANPRRCGRSDLLIYVPGDTVLVTKLDRLVRSSRDLHNMNWMASLWASRVLERHGTTRLPTLAG